MGELQLFAARMALNDVGKSGGIFGSALRLSTGTAAAVGTTARHPLLAQLAAAFEQFGNAGTREPSMTESNLTNFPNWTDLPPSYPARRIPLILVPVIHAWPRQINGLTLILSRYFTSF